MKHHSHLIAAAVCAAACAAAPAHAQDFKAGLWEINSKMQSSSGQMEQAMAAMQKQMANMSPEQRKMMEDMLSKQGMNLSSMSGNAAVVKMCVTKEMAAQKQVPMQASGNCTQTRGPMVGNTMHVSVSCTNPPATGEGQATFSSDSAFTATMKMSTQMRGKPETMGVDASGRWLGADCGNVRPPAMPAPVQ